MIFRLSVQKSANSTNNVLSACSMMFEFLLHLLYGLAFAGREMGDIKQAWEHFPNKKWRWRLRRTGHFPANNGQGILWIESMRCI
jgi:hypothetical protein